LITQDTQELVVSGVTFMVMGMFLGNLILIVLGLFPIVFLALGILIGQPQEVTVTREGEDAKVWVDNQIADSLTATFSDPIPSSFNLDEGTNVKFLWKGVTEKQVKISYRATCAKRGRYELNDIDYETRHPLQITDNKIGKAPAPRAYIVQPKPMFVRRIRERKAITRIPMPMEARIKFGFPTTDFLEVRDYQPGDLYRNINWKVTARRLSSSPSGEGGEEDGLDLPGQRHPHGPGHHGAEHHGVRRPGDPGARRLLPEPGVPGGALHLRLRRPRVGGELPEAPGGT
jgi:uncharacterized protein (DUF58 family)